MTRSCSTQYVVSAPLAIQAQGLCDTSYESHCLLVLLISHVAEGRSCAPQSGGSV